MWRIKMLIINRRLQELLDDLLAAKPRITRMVSIRYVSWLLVAGAASGLIVLVAQTIGRVPVAEAAHRGSVQLGHFNQADYATGITTAEGEGLYAAGHGPLGPGVRAHSFDADGVVGAAIGNPATSRVISGVIGTNYGGGFGVFGKARASFGAAGVYGQNNNPSGGVGVSGDVQGGGPNAYAVIGFGGEGTGVYGHSSLGYAGLFNGNVQVVGTLSKGAGAFKIDHPLDPANKYLSHSFVESPDMKTIYDGVVVLDAKGAASVELPAWFEALNRDFRYQLTAIGASAPNLYIAEKISKNRFKIAGGPSDLEVSWQVTGIRHDPYAEQHRILIEEHKSAEERGTYLYPKEHGQPETMGIRYAAIQKMQQMQVEIQKHHKEMEQRDGEMRKLNKETQKR